MITAAEAKRQYDRAKRLGWIPMFAKSAASRPWCSTADLMGIGSRETNLDPIYLTKTGDHGNGFGLMQVDRRYFPEWTASGKWRDARECIEKGAEVLAQKRAEVIAKEGHVVSWRTSRGTKMTFRGAPFNEEQLRRITFAAYNSGIAAYHHFSTAGMPDKGTTGKDYSADVIARSKMFGHLIRTEGGDPGETVPVVPIAEPETPVTPSAGVAATVAGGSAVAVAGGAAVATSDGGSWWMIAAIGLMLMLTTTVTIFVLWAISKRK